MMTAYVPPFGAQHTLHSEPGHPCAGCCQLAAVGGHGHPPTHYCRLHISPFTRCIHYAHTQPGDSLLHRLGGCVACE